MSEEEREHVEAANDGHRPDHRSASSLRRGHGKETHEYVRQSRGAEHQRHAERDLVDRILEQQCRLEESLPQFLRRHVPRGIAEQGCHSRLHLGIVNDGLHE